MRITRDNYEVYFIDFIDGNLDASLQEEMQLFLAANPDLAEEMDGLEGFSFKADTHSSINKFDLYKSTAPGEAPVHPPVVSKHEKPVGAKPIVLPRLKAPEIVFDAKALLYQQPSAATVIPMAPQSTEGAKVVTMRRVMYYTSAAAAIVVLLWFNLPSTSHKAGMASEWEKKVIEGVSKDSTNQNSSPVTPNSMNRVDDANNDVAYSPKKSSRPGRSNSILPKENQIEQENSPKEIIELPEENYANQIPVNNNVIPSIGNGVITTSSKNSGSSRRYSNVFEFAETKAKETLWGSEDYPTDNFTSSLVKRQFEKTKEERDLPLDIESQEEGKRRVWRIRIGKFEYIRTR